MSSIAPTTHLIEAYKRNGLHWKLRIGEFIDNAFDAGATCVSFTFQKRKLVIEDDGNGCPTPENMVRLGGRHQQPGDILGRYGIGIKEAAISTADAIHIETNHKGKLRTLRCDWKYIQHSGIWEIEDPQCEDSTEQGTRITLSGMSCDPPTDKDKIVEDLSLLYTPAIKRGKQIKIAWTPSHKVTVPVFSLPKLDNIREDTVKITTKKGKVRTARVQLGIIPQGESTRLSGLIIAHHYRVITSTKKGLSEHPIPSLFGWVDLLDGWTLGKNKDHISEDLPLLIAEIRRVFEDTIQHAEGKGMSQQFAGIGEQLTNAMRNLNRKCKKAKRSPRKTATGAKLSTGGGPSHQRAARTQSGTRFPCPDSPETRVQIVFTSLGEDGPASQWNDDYTLEINSDIAFLKAAMLNTPALTMYAANILAAHLETKNTLYPTLDTVQQKSGDLLRHLCAESQTGSEAA